MHEDAANGVHSLSASFVLVATADPVGLADRLGVITCEGKFSRVVEHEDWTMRRGESVTRRFKMSGEDLCLAYPIIVEKAICRLRRRPIPACQWDRSAETVGESLD